MSAIIHINDNNIMVHEGDSRTRSQGYAWLSGDDVYFDLDKQNNAIHHCRLEPQQINSSYWQQCAQTSIAQNTSGMRHAADLIWRHLSELQSNANLSEVKLVVPSHYQAENLQLLLGICKASNIKVIGVVNKAVLALQERVSQEGCFLHIDVQLHQTVCSEVLAKFDSNGSSVLSLGEIEVLHEVGLQAMQDALLKEIQERFILGDRFDPLHYAETEQQLFDQLPELASALKEQGKANIAVQHQGRQHATSIDLKQWNTALEVFSQNLKSVSTAGQVDHRYYDFNGFQAIDINDTTNTSVAQLASTLQDQARTFNGLTNKQLKDSEGRLIYLTELEVQLSEASSQRKTEAKHIDHKSLNPNDVEVERKAIIKTAEPVDSPTHLLQAGQAVALDNARIELADRQIKLGNSSESNLDELIKSQKVFIMGDTARDHLRIGDRLGSDLGDGVITVIQVLDSLTGEVG